MPTASKLGHALALAAAGFYVFRIKVNDKEPLRYGWQKFSTRDPEIIRGWWYDDTFGHEHDWNTAIDAEKSGVFIVDADCAKGKPGLENFAKLDAEFGFPPTRVAITRSGGRHHFYKMPAGLRLRCTRGILAPGIDTRGAGGYVLGAGSVVMDKDSVGDGSYYWSADYPEEMAELPQWIIDKLQAFQGFNEKSQAKHTISEDDPIDIEAAIDFLIHHDPAIQGAGGDNHTFITICQLKEIGVSMKTACELLKEHWNPRCSPPWEHSDLVKKIKSAYRSAQSATGSRSSTEFDNADTFFHEEPLAQPQEETPRSDPNFFTPLAMFDPAAIPRRQRVFGDLAIRKILSLNSAPPGQGKSTLFLTIAVSKATGMNLLGIEPHGAGNVALWNNEDDMEEQHRRLAAILQHFEIPLYKLEGKLFLNSGEQRKLRIAKRNANGELIPADAQSMIDSIRQHKIDLLIVDPFAETHPGMENSNEEMGTVSGMYRSVSQLGNCGVVAIHHTRKLDGTSSEGHSGNLDSMRGAGALGGVARVVTTYNGMNGKQAKLGGVDEAQRGRYAVLETAKANFSAPGANLHYFERKTVMLNPTDDDPGEPVGIIVPVTFAGVARQPTSEAQQLLRDVAECVMKTPLTFRAIAQTFIENKPAYIGKQLTAVEKAIRRLFEDRDEVFVAAGKLTLEETLAKGKAAKLLVTFTPDAVADML